MQYSHCRLSLTVQSLQFIPSLVTPSDSVHTLWLHFCGQISRYPNWNLRGTSWIFVIGQEKFPPNKRTGAPGDSECPPVVLQVSRSWQMSWLWSLVSVFAHRLQGVWEALATSRSCDGANAVLPRKSTASVVEIYTDNPSVDLSCYVRAPDDAVTSQFRWLFEGCRQLGRPCRQSRTAQCRRTQRDPCPLWRLHNDSRHFV